MTNYSNIKDTFKKNSRQYNHNANIQQKVKNILISRLHKSFKNKHVDHILNIGVRDSAEPLQLLETFNPKCIDAIDLSLENIDTNNHTNINFYENNFDTDLDLFRNKYQLIFSNMSFQWSNSLDLLLKNLHNKMDDSATLAFSTLLSDNFFEIKDTLRINAMYRINEIQDLAKKNGYIISEQSELWLPLYFENSKKLIQHLRNTGVTTYTGDNKPTSQSIIKNFLKKPTKQALTYHVGIFIFKRAKIQ